MAHGEGPETEHGLQLAQVLAPGLLPLVRTRSSFRRRP